MSSAAGGRLGGASRRRAGLNDSTKNFLRNRKDATLKGRGLNRGGSQPQLPAGYISDRTQELLGPDGRWAQGAAES